MLSTFLDIFLLIKHLARDTVFEQYFEKKIERKTLLCKNFEKSTISISSKVVLKNNFNCTRKNWQNVNMQTSSIKNYNIDDIVEERDYNIKLDIEIAISN